jgi:hypothetical protein
LGCGCGVFEVFSVILVILGDFGGFLMFFCVF